MNRSGKILLVLVFALVLLAVCQSATNAETKEGPIADQIKLVIPQQEDGWSPDCQGIRDCVMACFTLAETPEEDSWEMDCFPWVPEKR
jgi:hypothetical protein